jgi:putative ABC transport system ATP-binding protein
MRSPSWLRREDWLLWESPDPARPPCSIASPGLNGRRRGVTGFGVDVHSLSARNLCLFSARILALSSAQQPHLLPHGGWEYWTSSDLESNGRKKREQRIADLLERIGPPVRGPLYLMNFQAEMQRVAVARAIAHSPRLVLADEPTASLDSVTGWNLVKLMFDMGREQGCTMIVSTHDPEILGLADSSIRLRDGRLS